MTHSTCRLLCVDDHHDTSEMLQLLLVGGELRGPYRGDDGAGVRDGGEDPVRPLRPR